MKQDSDISGLRFIDKKGDLYSEENIVDFIITMVDNFYREKGFALAAGRNSGHVEEITGSDDYNVTNLNLNGRPSVRPRLHGNDYSQRMNKIERVMFR